VYSIGTTSGGPHAAMLDKVANNSPDNRTLNATAWARISLTREGNGGETRPDRENLSACLDSLSLSEVKFEHIDGVIRRELVIGECALQPEQPAIPAHSYSEI
jgi:hypothetical protein